MRSIRFALLIVGGLVVALAVPASACPFQTQADASQQQQQTAQAESATPTSAQ